MKKILIVDDEMFTRYIIKETLQDSSFQIFEAKNGHGALKEAERIHPDMMILDVKMEGIDGFTVAREYKKVAPSCAIIILTAESDWKQMYEENKEYINHLINKPCNLETLDKMVRETLGV